jgi:subtilisin family serine protease/chitodextrinase
MKIIKFSSISFILLTSILFKVTLAESLPPKNQVQLAGHSVRSDQVIVRFKNNQQTPSVLAQQASLLSTLDLKVAKTIRINKGVTAQSGVKQDLVFTVLSLKGSKDLKTILKQLNDHPSVLYAEPDYIRSANVQPNDPDFSQLWGLNNSGQEGGQFDADIDAPEAWDTSTGSANSVIGVIDTGVDYIHEDLAANMWINPSEIPDDGIDNDNNGYVDDIHGIDCVNNDSDPMDDASHGTHVAGTIGAEGNNGVGITGVNWNIKIMALKFLDASGNGTTTDQIECLAYAVNMKKNHGINIRITNNSYGGAAFTQVEKDAIQASADANMLFIAAAGNEFNNNDINPSYPATYDLDNIISVAATDRTDNLPSFSNFGVTTVDIGAPGVDILSTTPGNQYQKFDGTSMASPHVAGAAALLWSNTPSLSALAIKNKLILLADPVPALASKTVSGRRLNINTALNCIPGTPVLEILTPRNQFNLPPGNVTVKVQLTDCGESITNINVVAVSDNGGASFTLFDNGQNEDANANDGVYTGIWQLQSPIEATTLTVNADSLSLSASVTGEVVKNYKLDDNHPFQWIDATPGTRLDISDSDDATETVAIGFNFEFYGVPYSEIEVDSNGILKFGNNNSAFTFANAPIPTTEQPNGIIAPYWDDLLPGISETANIYSLLEGTAPNRSLTIAWVETPFYNEPASDSPVTVEATLYEGSNEIIFQYGDAYLADSATIGVEHQSGGLGLQYLHNGANTNGPIQIQEEQAIRFFIEDDTPPDTVPPSVPTGLTLNSATANAVNFSWTPSTDDQGTVVLYHIMRDGVEIGTSTVASFTDNTVTADTAYVYNVTAEDDSGNESAASADLNVNTSALSELELIAGYPFEEGSGQTVLDLSGNENNGTLQGNALRNITGIIGEAIEFDGSNSHINLGSIDINSPALSIALWFKADDFGTHDARLISKATGTAESAHYWMISTIRSAGQHKLRFRLKTSNGGTSTLIGNTTLIPGVWTHVTSVYDGATMKLYQDGVQVGSLAKSGNIATSASIETWIGANPGNTRYFDGLIDDVRIYGEVLDLATIEDIIQGNLPLIDDGDNEMPTTPGNLTAVATATQVDLNWDPSTDNVEVARYRISLDGNEIGTTTATSFQESGLIPGQSYDFSVIAEDTSGNLSTPATVSVTTLQPDTTAPSIPTELTLNSATATAVSFSWTPSTDDQGTVAFYHILRDGTEIGTSPVASFTDNTVTADIAYVYTVTAEDNSGNESAASADLNVDISVPNGPELLAGYPFEEGSGQAVLDLSGNGNNGTLQGNASRNLTGKFGEAIEFNGSNSYINLDSIDITSPALSIALWFKADDFGTHDARLISKATGTANAAHYWMVSTIRNSGQHKLRFRLKTDNGGTSTLIGNATLTPGIWTHVTALYDGVAMKLFQNGVQVGSLAKSGAIATSTSVETWIGANPGNTRYFDGLIDDVRIYGEALDLETIEDIIQGNLPLIDDGDNEAPSVPTGLILNSVTTTAVSFSWTPSTDNQGIVALYHIMRDGIEIATSSVAFYADNTVAANTSYVYTVTAEDDSGNESATSSDLNVDTSTSSEPELIAAYPFEEGSGQSILDLSGNGNNGSLQGNATRNPTGKVGEAIEFNGSNSYINLGSLDITSPTLSIAMWFKPDDFGTHDARLISKATGTAESAHYWMISTIRSSGQHKLRFRLKTNNGGTSTLIGNAALNAGDWTHVTATYDGVTMKLFQDGVQVGSLAKTGTIATSASVEARIGANPGNTRYFDGLIDDVRIYGEALDSTTIQDIVQGNLPI